MVEAPSQDPLRPYLTYSFLFHLGLLVLFLARGLVHWRAETPSNVYTIDFVGPSASIATSGAASLAGSAKPAPARSSPYDRGDDFTTRRHGPFVLPKPSLLAGYQAPKAQTQPTTAVPDSNASATSAKSAGNADGGEAGTGIATDMPNFPYPWYISQVRAGLWGQWSTRRPAAAEECVVEFSIMPNGSIVDLRVEDSSGDSAFDLAAMGAAQDAAPFPPLPKDFREPFLKIHVTLKSQ